MKKKVTFLFIIIFSLLILCNTSYATENGIAYVKASKDTIEKGEEIEITVNLKGAKTAALNLSLYFDNSKLEYISEFENANLEGDHIIFVWYDAYGGHGAKDGEVARLKFKAKEEGMAIFSVLGEFYNADGQAIKMEFESKQIQIGKVENNDTTDITRTSNLDIANTNLETLAIENTLLYPPFDNNETKYNAEVSNDLEKLNILAIPQNENAKVKISGIDNLREGDNTINITVTAEDGTTSKVYEIVVHKRSAQEENKYEEEQNTLQEKLDEAYNIEKVSSNINGEINVENNLKSTEENSNSMEIIIVTIIVVGLTTTFWYFYHKKE